MKDHFREVLASFKQDEKPEVVLSIVGDSTATKILVAWTNAQVRQQRSPFRLRGQSQNSRWNWLWNNVSFSLKEIATRSGVPLAEARAKITELIGNRVIYPDGTLNGFVQRYLRKAVLDLFNVKPLRSRRRQPDPACSPG